jgi:DNA-binding NtrC family response regulator
VKILIVDDEQLVRWFLDRTLTKSGHKVTTAGNVEDALIKLSSEAIDVIIADLRMPKHPGTELIGRVDVRGTIPRTIICSAFITYELEEELRHKGICTLRKPFNLADLKDIVQNCLQNDPRESKTDQK